MITKWGDKPYRSLDYDIKNVFNEKLYKVTLNAGLTCPNRDGSISEDGCIFCGEKGSGDFAGDPNLSITKQLERGKEDIRNKRPVNAFIAYFQAFTNTYGDLGYLRKIYLEATMDSDVKLISIATRPDCLSDEVLDLLSEVNKIKPIWIELGLQTTHDTTAELINRGYSYDVFLTAVEQLFQRNIPVVVHLIVGLPEENEVKLLETVEAINSLPIMAIKFSMLHILKDTKLAEYYKKNPYPLPTMEEYIILMANVISRLNPDISIHRLTGDGPSDFVITPLWTKQKRTVLNELHRYMKEHDLYQGKYYDSK